MYIIPIKKVSHISLDGLAKEFYEYLPTGQKRGGYLYPTLDRCKKSLEDNDGN